LIHRAPLQTSTSASRGPKVRIKRLRALGDVSTGAGDPELVVPTAVAEADEFETRIDIEIDQVAVGRSPGDAGENAHAAIIAVRQAVTLCSKTAQPPTSPDPLLVCAASDAPLDLSEQEGRIIDAALLEVIGFALTAKR
jgi:hypothetical protein